MTQSIKIKKNIFWSIIPAKENSVRIKNKNIQKINGLMLFEYSVISSLKIKSIEKTFISTDSKYISNFSNKKYGKISPFLRPKKIALKNSNDFDYVIHFLKNIKKFYDYYPEYLVQLRPTTPFRDTRVIKEAMILINKNNNCTSLRSSSIFDHPPEKMFRSKGKYYTDINHNKIKNEKSNLPSHYFKDTYLPNGYIDILKTKHILNKKNLYGNKILKFLTKKILDIDTYEDLIIAKKIFNK